jgi:integrase/recombinase XerD
VVGLRGKPLNLTSQLHALVNVRVFFRWLVRRGYVLADPSTAIALPKQKEPLPKSVMTRREMERILNTPNVDTPLGLRDRAILELMYSTGLRNMEVRNLKLYDVNTKEGEAYVRYGKGGVGRVVPLGEIAAKYVDLYVKDARLKLLGWKEDSGYLFLGRSGKQLDKVRRSINILFSGLWTERG